MFFFFKQKTAYEMRISDWSSDVCSSDLEERQSGRREGHFEQRRSHPQPFRVRHRHQRRILEEGEERGGFAPPRNGLSRRAHIMTAVPAKPYEFDLQPDRAAMLLIDMQRDFMEPGGFGDALGNDVSQLRRTIAPLAALLAAARSARMLLMHTRAWHKRAPCDLHETKKTCGTGALTTAELGSLGLSSVISESGPGSLTVPDP